MPKAPTTYEDLRNSVRTDREALTLAAVLPNLPEDDRIIDLRGYTDKYTGTVRYETDDDIIDDFVRHETPIVPGTDLYRVRIATGGIGLDDDTYRGVEPVPHGRRMYGITRTDFSEFVPVDVEDAEYEDAPYHTLTDFGFPSPYFRPPARTIDGDEVFERKPRLPV